MNCWWYAAKLFGLECDSGSGKPLQDHQFAPLPSKTTKAGSTRPLYTRKACENVATGFKDFLLLLHKERVLGTRVLFRHLIAKVSEIKIWDPQNKCWRLHCPSTIDTLPPYIERPAFVPLHTIACTFWCENARSAICLDPSCLCASRQQSQICWKHRRR